MTSPISSDFPTTHPYRTENWEREIYPMPAFPTLLASDVARLSEWYQRVLGFVDVFTMNGPDDRPVVAHLRWAKWADLLIARPRQPTDGPRGQGITLNFMTLDADAVAERARAAGATIVDGPADRPWNARDVTIADPEGYRLTFTAPLKTRVSMDEIVKRARGETTMP